jgi:hypothetical protein
LPFELPDGNPESVLELGGKTESETALEEAKKSAGGPILGQ